MTDETRAVQARDAAPSAASLTVRNISQAEAERAMADAMAEALGTADHASCGRDAAGHYTTHVNCAYAHYTARIALGHTFTQHHARLHGDECECEDRAEAIVADARTIAGGLTPS